MKRSLTLVFLLTSGLAAGSAIFTGNALAQSTAAEPPSAPMPAGSSPSFPSGGARVAVIVFQQAVAQTNEGQRNFAQLTLKFQPKQTALKAQSDEIDSLKKQLQTAGSTLSDQERDTRLRTIDEKTKALQRTSEDDQNDFNSEMNEVYQALAQKVYAVLDAYAKQNNFTLVLDASNQQTSPVLWLNPSTDITKAVVEAYNVKSGVPPPAQSSAPRSGATSSSRPAGTIRPRTTTQP